MLVGGSSTRGSLAVPEPPEQRGGDPGGGGSPPVRAPRGGSEGHRMEETGHKTRPSKTSWAGLVRPMDFPTPGPPPLHSEDAPISPCPRQSPGVPSASGQRTGTGFCRDSGPEPAPLSPASPWAAARGSGRGRRKERCEENQPAVRCISNYTERVSQTETSQGSSGSVRVRAKTREGLDLVRGGENGRERVNA